MHNSKNVYNIIIVNCFIIVILNDLRRILQMHTMSCRVLKSLHNGLIINGIRNIFLNIYKQIIIHLLIPHFMILYCKRYFPIYILENTLSTIAIATSKINMSVMFVFKMILIAKNDSGK